MFTAIGDVHGKYDLYLDICGVKERTLQIGDLGFRYGCLENLDPESHKIVAGNHDNYDTIAQFPNYLGDWGFHTLGGTEFFFLRGAYSIDSRASRQRKQLQASYAISNRSYDNRVMISYGSGILNKGWSYALSGSRRWANSSETSSSRIRPLKSVSGLMRSNAASKGSRLCAAAGRLKARLAAATDRRWRSFMEAAPGKRCGEKTGNSLVL